MSWAFPNIPQRLLLYWGRNQPLSWLRYQTIERFAKLNPDWEIRVYTPEAPSLHKSWQTGEHRAHYQGPDHWSDVLGHPRVEVHRVDWDSTAPASEVHRSDLIRYQLLCEVGGVWADMDIVWLHPMADIVPDSYLFSGLTAAVCKRKGRHHRDSWHSIGFLWGAKGSPFWQNVHREAQKLAKTVTSYQGLGRELLDRLCPDPERMGVGNIPYGMVYPVLPSEVPNKLAGNGKVAPFLTAPSPIGVHWFAGHPASSRVEATGRHCTLMTLARL